MWVFKVPICSDTIDILGSEWSMTEFPFVYVQDSTGEKDRMRAENWIQLKKAT